MSVRLEDLGVGDVICTRTNTFFGRMIRFGAALRDEPNTVNHVLIVHHRDPKGTLWGLEGRPGGVGWVAITPSLVRGTYVIANTAQPKTQEQRFLVAKASERLIHAPYDYEGILLDGLDAIHIDLWGGDWGPKPPVHVVCSSYADWCYDKVGLASPGTRFDRLVKPADWAAFIDARGWRLPAAV